MSATKLKLLFLYQILYDQTDAQHRLSVPELVTALQARGVNAERKSVYRDLSTLLEFGYPIGSGKTGYYLKRREFLPGELKLLMSAVQAAVFITKEDGATLLQKLAAMTSVHQRAQLVQKPSIGGIKSDAPAAFAQIEAIASAIAQRRCISFSYYKRDFKFVPVLQRGGRRYVVSPYAMIWMQDRYYLVCRMQDRDDLTHFRLDRMQNVLHDPGDWRHFREVSAYETEFDISDYAKKCVNMFGGKVDGVTLSCDNSLSAEVYDRFGESMILTSRDEQRFTLYVEAVAGDGLKAWVLQFADRVEVKSPAALRESVKQALALALSRYES